MESDEECDAESLGEDARERFEESGETGQEDAWQWVDNINMD